MGPSDPAAARANRGPIAPELDHEPVALCFVGATLAYTSLELGCRLVATAHAFSKCRKFTSVYLSSSQRCPQTMQLDAKARQCKVSPSYSKVLILAAGTAAPLHFSHDSGITRAASTILTICHETESEARDVLCSFEIHMRTDHVVRPSLSQSAMASQHPRGCVNLRAPRHK